MKSAAHSVMIAIGTVLLSNLAFALTAPTDAKPRVVVMTDIGGDPDDEQSIVRFLLYACDFDVEGLCTGFGHGHYQNTRPDLLHKAVDAYGQALPNLRRHRPDYPDYQRLKSLVKDGHNGDPHAVGPGMDSEASEWIIRALDRAAPRPVWFTIWGGPRELAQAIWKVAGARPAQAVAAFKAKIRVHSIADQDRTALWVKSHHPNVFWIYSNAVFRGIWKEGDQRLVSPEWLEEHLRSGHGPLGTLYRRMIVQARGKPVAPPTSAVPQDLHTPVTKLEGPPAETGPWRFFRAINLHGPALKIDGQPWEGDDAPHFECKDTQGLRDRHL